jgi:Uma2 family endonuclease
MAVTNALLSVAEFARLPRPAGGIRQELHHGELVELPEEICLRHGGREFWLVDPGRESVKVIRADVHSSVHDAGGVIESGALGVSITVRDIFAR